MLVGRRAEGSTQPGGRVVLERRRWRARIIGPGAGGAAGENQGEPNQDRAEEATTAASARDSAEPAALLVRCVSARIRRQSATCQGVPRRMALSYLPRPAGKRGNGNSVKRTNA